MYLMTGVWRGMFAKFGTVDKVRKEDDPSDNTAKIRSGDTQPGNTSNGSDEGR